VRQQAFGEGVTMFDSLKKMAQRDRTDHAIDLQTPRLLKGPHGPLGSRSIEPVGLAHVTKAKRTQATLYSNHIATPHHR
jgi:hypothetical protein